MISNLDYKIYKAIEQEKKLTEIYIGYQEFDWFYTKALYSATCTEAIDFTLFDKTICGLLQIEESLSLEEIGEILGFNVIENPTEKRYKDQAEYEILKEALQSLEEYEMIDGGDIYFSYCTLTPTGKEYVAKGKKFKIHENKEFTLFFDNTNNDHAQAKANFKSLKANSANENENENSINYENENFLKTFAEHQIPEIYNPEKMNSFKDTILQNKTHYKTILFSVFLLDINTGKHRTLVFEDTHNKINEYFTEYIKNNIEFDTQYFNKFLISKYHLTENMTLNKNYIEQLNKFQEKIEVATQENENFTKILNDYYNNIEFIEPELFISKFFEFIKSYENEIWIIFNEINTTILSKIKSILNQPFQSKRVFIFIPKVELLENEISKLSEQIDKTTNFYIFIADKIEEFNIIYFSDNKWHIYKKEKLSLKIHVENQELFTDKEIVKKNISLNSLDNYINNFRLMFASKYIDAVIENAIITLNNKEQYDKQLFNEIQHIDQKILPFSKLDDYSNQIVEFQELRDNRINEIKRVRRGNILKTINNFTEAINKIEQINTKILEKLKSEINEEKEKCLDFELELFAQLDKKINFIEKEIELINKRKSIIIDTNILIEEPNITKIIGQKETIVFSGKVIDELDYLKTKPELKEKAQNAIRNIKRHQSDKNIKFNFGKIELLPDDFDKKSPDNLILSVAIQYKKHNPVLLTNDNGMHLKAKMLGISSKTIEELKILLQSDKKSNTKTNKNRKSRTKKRK